LWAVGLDSLARNPANDCEKGKHARSGHVNNRRAQQTATRRTLMATVESSIVLKRLYDVPAARLWRAWSTADELAQWYRPSLRHTIDFAEFDFRVGGEYRVESSLRGKSTVETGRYIEILAMQKILYEEDLQPEGKPHHSMLDQIEFVALDNARTQLVVTATGHKAWSFGAGVNGSLESLAEFVERN
jgi:uncharacterized protein YndB with AHSA1/START domain